MFAYLIKVLLGTLLFLMPLYFDLRVADTFGQSKMAVLYLFSILLFSVSLAKSVYYEKLSFKRTHLDIPVLIFLLANIISATISTSPIQSIFGGYKSQQGLITILCYILIFFSVTNISDWNPKWQIKLVIAFILANILVCFFPTRPDFSLGWAYSEGLLFLLFYIGSFYLILCFIQDIYSLPKVFVFVALVSGLYLLYQQSGQDFIQWDTPLVCTTFGNMTFFSHYGLVSFFLAISIFLGLFSKEKLKKKIIDYKRYIFLTLSGLSLLIIFIAVFVMRVRSIFIAGFFGACLFLILLGFRVRREYKKEIMALCLIFVPMVVYYGFTTGRGIFVRTAKEVTVMAETEGLLGSREKFTTAAVRLHIWRGCFRIIKDYPLFGIGQETMFSIYPRYRTLAHAKAEGQYSRTDRAHNDVIDVVSMTGIFGLCAFLFLHITFLVITLKAVYQSKQRERIMLVGIVSAWAVYHLNGLLSFGTPCVNSMFWALSGIGAVLAGRPKVYEKKLPLGSMKWVVLGAILAFSILGLVWVKNIYYADIMFNQASRLEKSGNLQEAIPKYKEVLRLNPWQKDYSDSLLNTYLTLSRRYPNQDYTKEAVFWAERSVRLFPQDSVGWNFLGGAYYLDGVATGKDRRDEAVAAYKQTIIREPYLIDAYTNIGQITLSQGKTDEAYQHFMKVLSFEETEPRSLYYAGQIEWERKEFQKAKEHLSKLVKLHPTYEKTESAKKILSEIERK
ncbi:O-antigen ligase family protein [bacterium]|nr:O-antigen ligase family protein [bacterium]MBU1599790.1 O-antigen ligase family protein [bacterium]